MSGLDDPNPKSTLIQFCQKESGNILARDDIVFTTRRYPEGHQSTVRLDCLQGQEFAGDLASNIKDAEKSAAAQAVAFFSDRIEELKKQTTSKNKKKRKGTSGDSLVYVAPEGEVPLEPGAVEPGSEISPKVLRVATAADVKTTCRPAVAPTPLPVVAFSTYSGSAPAGSATAKSELNATCSKIVRRVMSKDDVHYETSEVEGGFQSTVVMPCLPDEWGLQVFAGEVTKRKADAEQSVAAIALEALKSDPKLMTLFHAPPKPKTLPPSGKGRGRGKGGRGLGGKGGRFGSGGGPTPPRDPPPSYGSTPLGGEVIGWGGYPALHMAGLRTTGYPF